MMKMTVKNALVVVLLGLACSVQANPLDVNSLQSLAKDYLRKHQRDEHISAVGLTAAIVGQPPVSVYAGSTQYDYPLPLVTEDSLFQIGSVTKSFIAAIVLQLEEDPRYHFSLDDPFDTILPEYSQWHGATIRQLMNMTSGIPSYSDDETFFRLMLDKPYRNWYPAEIVAFVYDQPLLFKPGTKWNYSNTNYLLLGMMIERLTGHSLNDEIKQRLIKPLGLDHTVYAPYRPVFSLLRHMVHGYAYRKTEGQDIPLGLDVTRYSISWAGAAGAMVSTAADEAKWVQALFTPDKVLSRPQFDKLTQLVSIKTGRPLKHLTKKDPVGFGMGIRYGYFYGIKKPVYTYEGMTLASRGFYLYEPDSKAVVAATLNSSVEEKDDHYGDLLRDAYTRLIRVK